LDAAADVVDHGVGEVGSDRGARRRGQDYVSLFMDLDTRAVLFATDGRDAATVARFAADLAAHGGDATQIASVCCDMSPALISGIAQRLPAAEITFDRYHVIQALNSAVDEVRRGERRHRPELAGSKYVWLKRPQRLSARQAETLAWLTRPSSRLATARAYRWRWDFDGFYDQPPELARAYLARWCRGASRSRLEPVKRFARMVDRHWDGILQWHRTKVSNGILEGANSLVQAAKRKARGYRNKHKMITTTPGIAASGTRPSAKPWTWPPTCLGAAPADVPLPPGYRARHTVIRWPMYSAARSARSSPSSVATVSCSAHCGCGPAHGGAGRSEGNEFCVT